MGQIDHAVRPTESHKTEGFKLNLTSFVSGVRHFPKMVGQISLEQGRLMRCKQLKLATSHLRDLHEPVAATTNPANRQASGQSAAMRR